MTPQNVRGAQFKSVRKGLDPDEVRVFLEQVATALEKAQNHSTAMEARARAAVHRLQEVTEAQEAAGAAAETGDPATQEPSAEQADAITKTLLLAQRTADSTVVEARQEADRMLSEAQEEAERSVASSQEEAARLLEEAREEARSVGEQERLALDSDVSALMARRDFLESDVDHLEKFLDAQRERLRDAAATLVEMAERVPAGLGEVHRPVLSAAIDDDDDVGEIDEHGEDGEDGEDDTGEFEPSFATASPDDGASDAPVAVDGAGDESAPDVSRAHEVPSVEPGGSDAAAGHTEPAHTEPAGAEDETPVESARPEGAPDDAPADDSQDSDGGFTLRFGDPS